LGPLEGAGVNIVRGGNVRNMLWLKSAAVSIFLLGGFAAGIPAQGRAAVVTGVSREKEDLRAWQKETGLTDETANRILRALGKDGKASADEWEKRSAAWFEHLALPELHFEENPLQAVQTSLADPQAFSEDDPKVKAWLGQAPVRQAGQKLCPQYGAVKTAAEELARSTSVILPLFYVPNLMKRPQILAMLYLWDQDLHHFTQRPCAPNGNVYEDFESGFQEAGNLDAWGDIDKKADGNAEVVTGTAKDGTHSLYLTATIKGWGNMVDLHSHYGGREYGPKKKLVFWAKANQDVLFTAGFSTRLNAAGYSPEWDLWPNARELKASTDWQKVEIPLKAFKDQGKHGLMNLNKVQTFRFYLPGPDCGPGPVPEGLKEMKGVNIYLDHIYFQ
jgi:hypothetical protein